MQVDAAFARKGWLRQKSAGQGHSFCVAGTAKIDAAHAFIKLLQFQMNTTFQTTTVSHFLDNFAGRRGMESYDDTKPIKIAECNRDFVWPLKMQKEFVRSILQGFPIPAMCIANGEILDGGNRSTTLWLYKNGAFTTSLEEGGVELDYTQMCNDRTLTRRWDSAVIPQQIITNATPDQVAQIYENLNKGIRLTFGQLLENRRHRPWVALAEAMIGRGDAEYPDRDLLARVWSARFPRTKNRGELAFAFQVLVSAERGPNHFNQTFVEHVSLIMSDVAPSSENLRAILEMIDLCDPDHTISMKKKKETFKKFIGAIIHDFHKMDSVAWAEKWSEFIHMAYNTIEADEISSILDVGVLRANHASRILGISENVRRFLAGELEIGEAVSDESSESDAE